MNSSSSLRMHNLPAVVRQIGYVVLCHFTALRWHSLWLMPLYFILIISAYVDALHGNASFSGFTAGILFPALMVSSPAFWMLKTHFANYRARLVPHYALPHLIAVSFLIFVGVIAHPFLLAYISDRNVVGSVTFACLLTGALSGLHSRQDSWYVFVFMLLVVFMPTEFVEEIWFDKRQSSWLHLPFLAFGIGELVRQVWRLSNMHEEMPGYGEPPQNSEHLTPAEKRMQTGRLAARGGLLQSLSDRWHDRLPLESGSRKARVRLLNYGADRLPFVLYFTGVFLVELFVLAIWNRREEQLDSMTAVMFYWLATLLPMAAVGSLSGRTDWIAKELLLPMSRKEFVDNLLWIAVRQALVLWLCGIVLLAATVLLLPPYELEHPRETCLAGVCLSLVMQLPLIGAMLLLALVKELLARVICIGMLALTALTFLSVWGSEAYENGNWAFVFLVALFTVPIGWAFLSNARSQWLNAEFG